MGTPRIVRIDQLPEWRTRTGRVPTARLFASKRHRTDDPGRGSLVLALSVEAAEMAGGPGWYAVAVEEEECLVLVQTKAGAPYAVRLREAISGGGGRSYRVNLGRVSRLEPWLWDFEGATYRVRPGMDGIRVDLLEEVRARNTRRRSIKTTRAEPDA